MKSLSGASLYGRPLASLTNIRLGWKGLPETNTLAYCENPLITAVKSFIVQVAAYVEVFFNNLSLTLTANKLECLFMPYKQYQILTGKARSTH